MIYRFGDFELDTELFELRRRGQPLAAERRILDLLIVLIERRARVVSREELLEVLWPDVAVREQVLSQSVYEARKLLGDDARRPACIQTVRGRGFRFVADVEEGGGLARPVAGKPPGFTPFVGRLEMLAALDEALEGACAGRGGLVVVSGEPGIGKSRLAEEFASRAGRRGVRVLLGRCPEDEGTPSFWPWAQLLRRCAAGIRPAELSVLTRGLPQLSLIVPELVAEAVGAGLEGLDPHAARFRVFDGVTQFFTRASAEEPLALVLDDLHRADHPSILLLRFLARYVAGIPLLVLGTYREAELHANSARAEVIAEVARETTVRPLRLEGFSREEIARFFIAHLGADPSPEVIAELHERTGGNPFFLTHLAPRIQENLESAGDDARSLPRTIREAIAQQLAGLPADCKELLEVAAVIGRDFRLQLLQAALGRPPSELDALLGQALDAGVVQLSATALDEYRFAHVLLRDVLYEGLEPARRIQLHAAILGGLEANEGPEPEVQLAELAHHSGAAASRVGREVAIDYATRAGSAARRRLAFEEAADHFERALTLVESGPANESTLCDLLLHLGEAQTRAGARETGRATLQRAATIAQRIGAPERLAEVALSVTPGFFSIEVGVLDHVAISLLEESLEALPEGAHQQRASVAARLAMALYWVPGSSRRREALVEEAETLSTPAQDPATLARVACARCAALWQTKELSSRERSSSAAFLLAENAHDHELMLMARVFRVTCWLEGGQLSRVEREVDEMEAALRRRPLRQAQWYVPLFRAMLAHAHGDLHAAEVLAAELIGKGARLDDANVTNSFAVLLSAVRWHQGRAGEILEESQRLVREFPMVPGWRSAYVTLCINAGRRGEAQAHYEQLVGQIRELEQDLMWLVTTTQLADASVELGDTERYRVFADLLAPFRDRLIVVGYGVLTTGSVARVLGRLHAGLRRWRGASALFDQALALERRAGAHVWLPYTHRDYAAMLIQEGRSNSSRRCLELVNSGIEIATSVGASSPADDLRRLARTATTLA